MFLILYEKKSKPNAWWFEDLTSLTLQFEENLVLQRMIILTTIISGFGWNILVAHTLITSVKWYNMIWLNQRIHNVPITIAQVRWIELTDNEIYIFCIFEKCYYLIGNFDESV